MLFKIPGIDNLVVNRIKERTTKKVVFESERTKIAEDKNKEQKQQKHKKERQYTEREVESAVEQLNNLLKEKDAPIYLRATEASGIVTVQVVDLATEEVVHSNMPLNKLLAMIKRLESSYGIVIDESV